MTEADLDDDQPADADVLEQVETNDPTAAKTRTVEVTAGPARGAGMARAQAEILGEYNLYNG
jgi:hypothetical protein